MDGEGERAREKYMLLVTDARGKIMFEIYQTQRLAFESTLWFQESLP